METIDNAVRKYDQNLVLKTKQREALEYLVQNRGDLIVNLPVGYGKSVIFHLLPEILGENIYKPVVIVVSPLNIIQKDQRITLKKHNISCCRLDICSNVEIDNEDSDGNDKYTCKADANIDQLKTGEFSIILCHPEALLNTKKGIDLVNSQLQQHVVAVVIDECHILDKWGNDFRTSFMELKNLKAFFPGVPFLAMSGTLTAQQKQKLPDQLGLVNHYIIESSPDKPNVFLQKFDKGSNIDVEGEYEAVTHEICDKLYNEKERFPVTLLFLPVHYMSQVLIYLNSLFNVKNIDDAKYSAICSGQDQYVIDKTITELKKANPYIRLVLTTSILGMGFDPENVTNIVHACPPRNISQYFQEIGRAGRRGQSAKATLYFNSRNIAKNLPGMNDDMVSYCKNKSSCLRNHLLSFFGFLKETNIEGCKCCSICKETCECEECHISINVI